MVEANLFLAPPRLVIGGILGALAVLHFAGVLPLSRLLAMWFAYQGT